MTGCDPRTPSQCFGHSLRRQAWTDTRYPPALMIYSRLRANSSVQHSGIQRDRITYIDKAGHMRG